jgi:hypothetical protein
MATTTFSGPVVSNNGFDTGTSASPLAVTTAQNINAAYATSSATTGDTRLKLQQTDLYLYRFRRNSPCFFCCDRYSRQQLLAQSMALTSSLRS